MNMGRSSKMPNILSDQSNTPSISKYFKETKAISKPSELTPTTSKHLQMKYDNFGNQPIVIPKKISFPQLGSSRYLIHSINFCAQ